MRIEKIELIGFKSFADKTTFALHPGITCIVGPNGCGKSNIVDAFRWVLGEQSAKSLRGEKMEEVIFNGSVTKKPKGMAEVTLVVSGMNGAGANNGQGQSDHVTVTRRLYRSGESEYMINKSTCRLKDIKDVFLDTGLDFKSYSILEQGRIGEILNSKPLERRFIIEEVAGVMKYKVRKAEALSKLESSRLNLLRINDIIAEVRKQINILDRLAKKAERYKKLSSEMHAIELKIARREYQQIKESFSLITEEYTLLKENEAVASAGITEIENRTETRRVSLLEKEKALEAVQNTFQLMEREIADIEREIAVARNDISNLDEYHEKLLHQGEDMDQRSIDLSAKYEELQLNSSRISEEMEALAERLKEKTENLRSIEESLSDKEELIEDKRREIFRVSDEISKLRNEMSRQESLLESLYRREDTSVRESGDSRRMLEEIETAISTVEAEIHGRNSETLLMKEKKEILTEELTATKAGIGELARMLAEAREELASCTSRMDSLKEIVFDQPTKELIRENASIRLISSVSDVFDVAADYEKAIESALSEKAESFILESLDDIEQAISALRGKSVDKTAFITASPLPSVPGGTVPDGVIGRALNFVKPKEGYAQVAENLLGSVLIVRDLKSAFDLKSAAGSYSFATMTGEVVEQSGAVVIGGEKGIFRRKREIRELEDQIAEKKAFIEQTADKMRTMQDVSLEKEEAIRSVDASIHAFEKEISLAKLTVEKYMEDKERMSRKLSYLSIELEEIGREKEAVTAAIMKTEEQGKAIEARKTDMETELLSLQESIAQKKSEIEGYRSEVTDLRLEAASNRERLEAVRNEMESAIKFLAELGQRRESLRTEIESVLARVSQRRAGISTQEDKLRRLVADADLVRQDISQKKDEIEKENEDLLIVEQELRRSRQQHAQMTARLSELDVLKAEHKMRIENLIENVRNNYGIEIESLELAEVTPQDEERLVELRSKIQEMGPVNLGTLEEYEELKTRYDFMTKQQEDLNKSIAELEEAIAKINQTTKKKLREAFEALKLKFAEVFVTLFGGGRAELVLTDEHNILETGIDIIAQPPGKKLQNLHLLSGGEKALTALSLQFASFLIKPTPLCILDEADAPLDESNTERYSKMIEALSKETQFIVVTHNRTTMGVAQHLYGVTMEEAGVTKVISMQLAEVGV
ncbi:MAG: chromosome segregation protein SMC [Nitrospirota bacterium]|nr:chromosome segregation protein SMC [Nitrospirota bacterium]